MPANSALLHRSGLHVALVGNCRVAAPADLEALVRAELREPVAAYASRSAGSLGLGAATPVPASARRAASRPAPVAARARGFVDTAHELVRQVGRPHAHFLHDVGGPLRECSARGEGVQAGTGCWEEQPARTRPSPHILALRRVGHVPDALTEVDHLFRELLDACHLDPFIRYLTRGEVIPGL
jgi:hypothetical protein